MGNGWVAGIALLSGAALALQVGFNGQLRSKMGDAILAAFVSFAVGTAVLAVHLGATRPSPPPFRDLTRAPWWIWLGGLVGAGYVASSAAFAGRLGAATWLGLIVTGQVLASIVLDHFGLVGFEVRPITPTRILGAILLLAGVGLLLRS